MAKKTGSPGGDQAVAPDEHAGHGGSYVIEGGQRVLKERTLPAGKEQNQPAVGEIQEGSEAHANP